LEETARYGPERSIMIACYHYSNFEWLSLASGFLDLKGTIISQEFKNSLLDPIFKKLREQSGHELIPRQGGLFVFTKSCVEKGAPRCWSISHCIQRCPQWRSIVLG